MKPGLLFAGAFALGLLSTSAFAANGNTRLELGLGAHWGDPELEDNGASADLNTDTGIAISGAAWFDNVGVQNLSLGVEFLHLRDGDYSESGTFSDSVITASGTLSIEPQINALMVNAAYRDDRATTKFHPYIGAGAGAAIASADLDFTGTLTVGGTTFTNASTDDDDIGFAWQFYAGADYDITDHLYIGAGLKYFGTDVSLFDVDVEFRNFVALAKIGYRF
jgi:opacity protein-like surface antigen